MIDSALNNVGTYGVRYDVTMNLRGRGAHQLVLSHRLCPARNRLLPFVGRSEFSKATPWKRSTWGFAQRNLALTDLRLTPVHFPSTSAWFIR